MKTQLDYYIENQDYLVSKYNNQLIVVKDGNYMGTFNSKTEALQTMQNNGHDPGTFIIIFCTPGDGEYTAHFHSNITFDQVGLD
jgi:hypothetical protein